MKLKKILAVNKNRFTRGYSWIGMPGMGLVMAKTVQEVLSDIYPIPIYVLFPSGIILLWFIGYLDHKLGFFNYEQDHIANNMTVLRELKK